MKGPQMRRILASVVAALLIGSCGGSGDSSAPTIESSGDLVQFMRETNHFDYEPVATPAELLGEVDVALRGTVVSVTSALQEIGDAPPIGAVIVGVRIDEAWKAAEIDSTAYFWFNRPTNVSIEEYQSGLPEGTRLAFFGLDNTSTVRLVETSVDYEHVYAAHPQGLLIGDGAHGVEDVWGVDGTGDIWASIETLDDVGQALRTE